MRKSGDEYAPPPEIVGNRRLMRFIGVVLLLGAPVWVESAWVIASWWRPIVGFGPLPGFKTPCLTFLKSLSGFGSEKASDVWGDMYAILFASPAQGITLFFTIAVGCILVMRRTESR